MTSLPRYEFDGYTFRPTSLADLPMAQQWNAGDPDHRWEAHYPRYWIEQSDRVNSYAMEDAEGIVFFVKSIRHPKGEIEITVQFDRSHETVSRMRVMTALDAGFAWLKEALPMNGFKSLYFLSENERLIFYAQKRFRFRREGTRLVHSLAAAAK